MCITASVVIPAYKAAPFIQETLESVFRQTRLPAEIIVVDDCSPDDTCNLVRQLAKHSPVELRLIQLEKNSGGPTLPMNVGVEAARSPLIAMLDHDDRMAERRLEIGHAQFQIASPDTVAQPIGPDRIGLAFGQHAVIDSHGVQQPFKAAAYTRFSNQARIFSAAEAFRDLIGIGYGYGGAGGMMFLKEAWNSVGGFRTQFTIVWDYDFAVRTTRAGWSVAYTPEILFYHRVHAENLEQADGGRRIGREVLRMLQELFGDDRLTSGDHTLLRGAIANRAILAAQNERRLGQFAQAAGYYGLALRQRTATWRSLRGLAKLPLMMAGSRFR